MYLIKIKPEYIPYYMRLGKIINIWDKEDNSIKLFTDYKKTDELFQIFTNNDKYDVFFVEELADVLKLAEESNFENY